MAPLRVAIIGCGRIARIHAEGYEQHSDLWQVSVTCDNNLSAAEALAQSFPDCTAVNDWRAVLDRADVDAVDICLPHDLHKPVAVAAAEAGKHVLIEKPLARNMEEAVAIVEAAERAGVTLMVAHNQRYMPQHRQVKELLERGTFGDLLCVRADLNQDLILQTERMGGSAHWLHKKQGAGGGAIISGSIHKLDLFRWLFGEVKRVGSFQRTVSGRLQGEDVAVTMLEFDSGLVGEIVSLYACRHARWGEMMIIHGTHGTLHEQWHGSESGTWVHSDIVPDYYAGDRLPDMKKIDIEPGRGFAEEIRHWGESITNNTLPLTNGRDGLRTMALAMAIYEAAEKKQIVDVASHVPPLAATSARY